MGKIVSTELPESTVDELDRIANNSGITRSELIRRIVNYAISEPEDAKIALLNIHGMLDEFLENANSNVSTEDS